MKLSPLLAALSLGSLMAACDSLDNPFHGLLNTGNDARVYNSSTGNYEWPNSTPHPRQPAHLSDLVTAFKATPTPSPTPTKNTDGRHFDPQKAAFVQGKSPSATPAKAKATPSATASPALETQATPAPPAPGSPASPLFPQ